MSGADAPLKVKCLTACKMQQNLFLPTLTLVQPKEINVNYNQQSLKLCAVAPKLPPIESATLVEQEDLWLAEREYYQDQFLYTDRV